KLAPYLEQREVLEDAVVVVAHLGAVSPQMRAELEVFVNRELGADAPAFWDVSDAAAQHVLGRHPSQGAAAACDIAAPAHPTKDRAQRRRLARAVGAEQRHDASF